MGVPVRDPRYLAEVLVAWLKEKVSEAGALGGLVGLSGGVDSAVVAALLMRSFGISGSLGVIMPCHNQPVDEEDARLVASCVGIPVVKVDLSGSFDALVGSINGSDIHLSHLGISNIKPRLRMTTLYAIAQTKNLLVCGTGNRAELTFGYFTKYGDSGVDLLPLGRLTKHEVWTLAEHLGIPERVVKKPPTAGLWEGQTDEGEMGVSYEDLDRYILGLPIPQDVRHRIENAFDRSKHKRMVPPVPEML
ncbi:MAG: NAD(+) synthase [Thermanaerothrix sp.]|nr:NAD(+) synthase [Thermanaerothrix sp.]